jgi:hypothetical protein
MVSLLLPHVLVAHSAARAQEEVIDEAGESTELAPGVTLTVLASEVADLSSVTPVPRLGLWLDLDRVILPPGASLREMLADAAFATLARESGGARMTPLLVVADRGAFTVTIDQAASPLGEGSGLLIPEGASFDVRNTGDGCGAFYLFDVFPAVGAGGYDSLVSGPSFSAQEECPPSTSVLSLAVSTPYQIPLPGRLFAARLTFDHLLKETEYNAGVDSLYHPGAAALVVESGSMTIGDATLAPGSTVVHNDHSPYAIDYFPPANELTAMASVLIVGFVPIGQDVAIVGGAYKSPTSNYALAYDEPWEVLGETWRRQSYYAALELSNGVANVRFEDLRDFGGDQQLCLTRAEDRLRSDPEVSNLRPLDPANGPAGQEVATRLTAEYAYTRTNPDGASEELVTHLECRPIGLYSGNMLLVTATFPLADAAAQREPLERLLAGLAT